MSDDDRTTSTLSRKIDQLAGLVGGDRARAERTYRMMVMAVGRNAQLANVAPERLFLAVQQILALNLDVGPMGAYPVPFKGDVTVIVSGQGLVELMMRSGLVRDVAARVVYEHDQFDLDYASNSVLHKPCLTGDKGAPVGAYALVNLTTGGRVLEWMSRDELLAIRDRSPSCRNGVSGPWLTDEGEMWRKTVLKRAAKYVPKSADLRDAIALDNADYNAGESQPRRLALPAGHGTAGTLARLQAPPDAGPVADAHAVVSLQAQPEPEAAA
jgi:recombination protein RecT